MNQIKIFLLALLVIAGCVATFFIHRHSQAALRENNAAIENAQQQIAQLQKEQQRLNRELTASGPVVASDPTAEIDKLRQQADSLRAQTKRVKNKRAASKPAHEPPPESHPPEYYQHLHERAGGKDRDALALGLALRMFANDHQGQFPKDVDQLAPYLQKEGTTVTGTNTFEILYQGTAEDLAKVPDSAIALIRDREVWVAPSGKAARVYGMADGSGRVVESEDDFQAWEAQHVLRTP